jgi:anthranilate synthase component 2
VVDEQSLPQELEVIARTEDQQIMALRHRHFDLRGLQFHPESILTEHGSQLIQNWIQS